MNKPQILVLAPYYPPGFLSGGPARSIYNVVEKLGAEFDFRVITSDRDSTATEPYPDIDRGGWQLRGIGQVFYAGPEHLRLRELRRIISSVSFDLLYVNDFFSPNFSIWPLAMRKFGLVPRTPVILAPRGEFFAGASSIKKRKKETFLAMARAGGLFNDVTWHASSELEATAIRAKISEDATVFVAPNLTELKPQAGRLPIEKRPGELRIVVVARVCEMKNLEFSLRVLAGLKGSVRFHIYGPREEEGYWSGCEQMIAKLHRNIEVEYRGLLEPVNLTSALADNHVFLLPTLGENFGHAIFEAMADGLPVIISDRTPWRNLSQHGAGFDLPLDSLGAWTEKLQQFVDMDNAAYRTFSTKARELAVEYIENSLAIAQTRAMFEKARTTSDWPIRRRHMQRRYDLRNL